MERHRADSAQVCTYARTTEGLRRGSILFVCSFLFTFCLFFSFPVLHHPAPPQKCPRAGAVLDVCAASAEWDRTGVPVVCAHEGRSGGEADDAGQAYADGEPGRGGRDADGDRVCGESADGCQGAV